VRVINVRDVGAASLIIDVGPIHCKTYNYATVMHYIVWQMCAVPRRISFCRVLSFDVLSHKAPTAYQTISCPCRFRDHTQTHAMW